jgi:NADP-dependent 3-hydroxy acid dehydrogenase YdfG
MSDAGELSGEAKSALVTGASGAIGGALTQALGKAGYRVTAVGRRREALAAADATPRVTSLVADLRDARDLDRVAAAIGDRLDVLVHAAGTYEQATFAEGPGDVLGQLWAIHVEAPWRLTARLLPALRAARGEVVFVNSSARPAPGLGPYAAVKAAAKALADSLRAEVNADGVRVLSVFPGRTAGELQARLHEFEGRDYRAARLLQPDDVARAILGALSLPRTAECTDLHLRPMEPS